MSACAQEMCPNWADDDGIVCHCALFGIEPPCPVCSAPLGETEFCPSCDQANGVLE